ncbi:MAG: hypothetical protein JXR51_00305 [Bacteroidales bacterium]|nr:hypothetical protein [Bacteroidales bacterium]MBN2755581.1 hypothetical protein [Bacteroidales bacterium]
MTIIIKEVKTKKDLKTYIYLPEKIHQAHKNWLHPIYSDEFTFYSKKKNHTYSYSDTVLYLAYENDIPVGRIMGIINHKYNNANNQKQARFSFLETYDNQQVADALLQKVETWAKDHKMEQLIGPFGFSDKEPQGLLIEGYDKPTVIVTNHSFKYLNNFVEANGFSKKLDLVQYKVEIPKVIPQLYQDVAERAYKNGYKIIEFENRKKLKPYILPVFNLINQTYTNIFGFAPFHDKEIFEFANRYIYLLNPKLVKIALGKDDKLLAFVIAMPDLSEGIRKAKGRLFPFGIFHILKSGKKTNQLNLLLGAIDEEYRNRGIDTMMAVSLLESASKVGLEYIDSHLVMEENKPMRAEMERLGAEIYKRYRVYEKRI